MIRAQIIAPGELRGTMKRLAIVLLLLSSAAFVHAETDNTFYAKQFPGTTVGAKVTAAQAACNLNIPCIIVIDPSLAAWPVGAMPSLCTSCSWFDYRNGAPGSYTLPTATPSVLGGVKPDGTTLTNTAGAISCTTATTSQIGCSKPDGSTITISAGVISASSSAGQSVRQTVSSGPVDTNGLPTLFPSTSASLSLTTQNVTASAPFVATASQGFNASGKVDNSYYSASNLTWSSLTAWTTVYLYINASTGVTGSTTLQPIYQFGGTPAVTSGQFTYNIAQMIGYMGNGSTAPATPLVFVGEAVTGASTVTSTVAYAYNGLYASPLQTMLAGSSAITLSHNLGLNPVGYTARWVMVCVTANLSYAPGAELDVLGMNVSTSTGYPYLSGAGVNRLSAEISSNATGPGALNPLGGGSNANITAADWNMRLYVRRSF
jgi:hypothetical protein